jgi:hypothetical protein
MLGQQQIEYKWVFWQQSHTLTVVLLEVVVYVKALVEKPREEAAHDC